MSPVNYKVILKGSKKEETKNLSLTFKSIISENLVSIPMQIILELKKLSENIPNVISYQNIDEVIKIGSGPTTLDFNYYYVILYSEKKDSKKFGFLIGNVKNKGDLLIGIWPFNEQRTEISSEVLLGTLNNLIKNPLEYLDISLIAG